MERRKFIKKLGIAAASAMAAPYILPSGRLFARSSTAMADHVVFVLFAGGVRQQESVLQRYLDDSQGLPYGGNILNNLLVGAPPTNKIVYGTTTNLAGDTPIPVLLNQTLQEQGVLFAESNANLVGHYAGLNALVTGNYGYTQGLRQRPHFPTIFEYVRKHLGVPATKTWFVGNGIGNSVPLLNYSTHPDYGGKYGANFLAPNITFSQAGFEHLSNAKVYHPDEELDPIYKMKFFLDQATALNGESLPGVVNTDDDKQLIKEFIRLMFDKTDNGSVAHPPVSDNNDMRTIGYACEVMKFFKPTLTVINLNNVDGCHASFTGYLRSLHRADHGVAHLWNYIQTQIPEMANNTALVLIPEHGRNDVPNPILDENDWAAYDHSDLNSRRIFSMMVGPSIPQNLTVGSPTNQKGDATDGVPTIAEILGIKNDVLAQGLLAPEARSMFDRL